MREPEPRLCQRDTLHACNGQLGYAHGFRDRAGDPGLVLKCASHANGLAPPGTFLASGSRAPVIAPPARTFSFAISHKFERAFFFFFFSIDIRSIYIFKQSGKMNVFASSKVTLFNADQINSALNNESVTAVCIKQKFNRPLLLCQFFKRNSKGNSPTQSRELEKVTKLAKQRAKAPLWDGGASSMGRKGPGLASVRLSPARDRVIRARS